MRKKFKISSLLLALVTFFTSSCKNTSENSYKTTNNSTVTTSTTSNNSYVSNTSSSSTTTSTCKHIYDDTDSSPYGWYIIDEPTLTTTGLAVRQCSKCLELSQLVLPVLNETDYKYTSKTSIGSDNACPAIVEGTGIYEHKSTNLVIDYDSESNHELTLSELETNYVYEVMCKNCGKRLYDDFEFDIENKTYNIITTCSWRPSKTPSYAIPSKYKHIVFPETIIIDSKEYIVVGVDIKGSFYTLVESVTLPDSVTSIGGGAFRGCTSLESITIPKSVTSIGGEAFRGCTSLESITIPKSVTSIGFAAFSGCTSLKSATILAAANLRYTSAFGECPSLETLVVDSNNAYVRSTDSKGNECNAIFSKDGKTLFAGCNTTKIPDSVTSIVEYAFSGSGITSITIPSSVKTVGRYAFLYCSSLESVTISEGVSSIGAAAFYGCTSLESITIPKSVSSIDVNTFGGCTSLESITIPNSVTSIDWWAFEDCTSLESITIPNSVTSIGKEAFRGCTSLESITIPNSVTSIGEGAFVGCTSLKSIIVSKKSITYNNMSTNVFGQIVRSIDVFVEGSYEEEVNEILTTFKYHQVYYLSDTQPTDSEHLYWHYVDGKPVKW